MHHENNARNASLPSAAKTPLQSRPTAKFSARLPFLQEQCRQASELLRSGASDLESPSGKKLRVLLNSQTPFMRMQSSTGSESPPIYASDSTAASLTSAVYSLRSLFDKASLQALMNERHGLLAWTSVNNPVIMHKLMTSKLVDPPVPDHEPPDPAFWQRILVFLSQKEAKPIKTVRSIIA